MTGNVRVPLGLGVGILKTAREKQLIGAGEALVVDLPRGSQSPALIALIGGVLKGRLIFADRPPQALREVLRPIAALGCVGGLRLVGDALGALVEKALEEG